MKGSKLFALLACLSDQEWQRLEKFIQSPLINPWDCTQLLLDCFTPNKKTGAVLLSREEAFARVFPDEAYHDQKLRLQMSYLTKMVEDFLVYEYFQSDRARSKALLAHLYKERQSAALFLKTSRAAEKALYKSPLRNADHHLKRFQLLEERLSSDELRVSQGQTLLEEISQELDYFFIIAKLQQACTLLSHSRLFKLEYQTPFLEEILHQVRLRGLLKVPAIGLYYQIYHLLTEETDAHFIEFKTLIARHSELFPTTESRNIYLIGVNFCIRKLNLGHKQYLREVFDLYLQALENHTLLEKGVLSPWTYKNIVSAGLKLGELKWVGTFLESYKNHLPPDQADSSWLYNRARLQIALKDYQAAAKTLYGFYHQDIFTYLDARVMLTKAYFELEKFTLLEYVLDNFKQLLGRKEVMAYHRNHYKLFLKFVRKLIRLKPGDQSRANALLKELQSQNQLIEGDWLAEKFRSFLE